MVLVQEHMVVTNHLSVDRLLSIGRSHVELHWRSGFSIGRGKVGG